MRRFVTCLLASALAVPGLLAPSGIGHAALEQLDLELLVDLNDSSAGSDPSGFVRMGTLVFFSAEDDDLGRELWVYDDTAGTASIIDVEFGPDGSSPLPGAVHDGLLYFTATRHDVGRELFVSDGTPSGTTLLKDIDPLGDGFPSYLTVFDDEVYFAADDGSDGRQLWKTDGTAGGTIELSSIGGGDPRVAELTPVEVAPGQHALYFSADDGVVGNELHRYRPGATVEFTVHDLKSGPDSSAPQRLEAFGTRLAMTADSTGTRSLHVATTVGAGALSIEEKPGVAAASEIAATDDGIFVHSTDYSASPPELTLEYITGGGSLTPLKTIPAFGLVAFGSSVVFDGRAEAAEGGREPWISDGTVAGTKPLVDLTPGGDGSTTVYVKQSGVPGQLLIRATTPSGHQIYTSDGTADGTVRITDPAAGETGGSSAAMLTMPSGTTLLAFGPTSEDLELWSSDGSPDSASKVLEINESTIDSYPDQFVEMGGATYFAANTEAHGDELRRLNADGSVSLVADIWPGESGSGISELVATDEMLYFEADDGVNGDEIWRSDGTAAGTELVSDLVAPLDSGNFDLYAGESLVYAELDDRLYAVDGLTVTELSPHHRFVANAGDHAFFEVDEDDDDLRITDGTVAGTKVLPDEIPALAGIHANNFVAFDGMTYFWGSDDAVWMSDGTVAGTTRTSVAGVEGSVRDVRGLHVGSTGIYLQVHNDDLDLLELWMSPSADQPPSPIALPGLDSSEKWAGDVVDTGPSVFFSVSVGGSSELETLYVTDGESATRLPLVTEEVVVRETTARGRLAYWHVDTNDDRKQLWVSDGTVEGSGRVLEYEIAHGFGYVDSNPAFVGDRLYLSLETRDLGVEPWFVELPELPLPAGSSVVSLEPGRVVESRPGLETVDGLEELGRMVGAGEEIEVLLAGRAGIDADAAAVVMNVTAVNPAGRGYLTIHPCGERPVASALNFGEAGVVVGNEVIARLSGDGTVCIYASEATHLTIDAVGFVPAGSSVVSLEPGRVVESRPGLETVDGVEELGRMVGAGEEIEVLLAGRAGIDADAAAVVMNVTAVNPAGRGYLTIHPCGERPVASALNFGEAGVVVGNEVIARLSGDGTVCIYASEATHLTIDAVGFVPAGSSVVSLEPGRVVESRPGLETVDGLEELGRMVGAGEEIEVLLAGRAGIDADAAAVVMNVTAVNPAGRGYLTIHPCGERPVASALNFGEAGVVVGNEVIARLSGDGTVCIYASEATHLTIDAVGYVASS